MLHYVFMVHFAIHSLVDGRLGRFCLLATGNNAVNVGVYIFLQGRLSGILGV